MLALGCPGASGETLTYRFNIPEQPADRSLTLLAQQAKVPLLFSFDEVHDVTTDAVVGEYTLETALAQLLAGTNLKGEVNSHGVLTVTTRPEDAPVEGGVQMSSENGDKSTVKRKGLLGVLAAVFSVGAVAQEATDADEDELEFEEIIVTGTNIRGLAPDASPIVIYSELDISKTGAATLEQFIAKLPQNLNSTTSTARLAGPENGSGRNGIDLRGLGTGTTLVLLNGKRLVAPGGASPDISLIPLSAIERIEILSDGASAVYGSDAIGGVVNIILKDDVDGVDAGLTYGTVTSGDHDQFKADITAGVNWDTGNITASYNFFNQSLLGAEDRDFAGAALPYFLLPDDARHSALGAVQQRLGDKLTFNADALYSTRKTKNVLARNVFDGVDTIDTESEQLFLNGGLSYEIDDNFTFELFTTYSNFTEDEDFVRIENSDGSVDFTFTDDIEVDELEFGAKIDGAVLNLPAGELRVAIGAGYGEETYVRDYPTAPSISRDLARDRYHAFGEGFVPIVGPEQDIPGINRLELNGAVRFTDYSDFGSNTSPRFGMLWSPVDGLNFRGTYSEAFRAPSLRLLGGNITYALVVPAAIGFPDPWSTDGSSVLLYVTNGVASNIGPEASESYTFGFDIDHTGIEGLSLSGTYFSIDYVGRLSPPDTTFGAASLFDPVTYASIYNENPTPALIAELTDNATALNFLNTTAIDSTDLDAIISAVTVTGDNRITNVASSKVEGLDFNIDYSRDIAWGELSFGGSVTYMMDSASQLVINGPFVDELNQPGQPVDLKFRMFAGLTRGGLVSQINLNYVDSYSDSFQTPVANVDSWTTVDLSLVYDFESHRSSALGGLQLSLNVINLFDQEPPFVALSTFGIALSEPVGFDPVNASPVGRFIQLGVRSRF